MDEDSDMSDLEKIRAEFGVIVYNMSANSVTRLTKKEHQMILDMGNGKIDVMEIFRKRFMEQLVRMKNEVEEKERAEAEKSAENDKKPGNDDGMEKV